MRISLRQALPADVAACGQICYEAFGSVSSAHGFPMDWRSAETAVKVIEGRLAQPSSYGVVAELNGRIVGSAFLKEYHPVGSIGPVTVTPRLQDGKVGRLLMEHLIDRASTAGLEGTRLVQAAFNMRSLALYIKLGFQVKMLLACLHGNPIAEPVRGHPVRAGTQEDMSACNDLCSLLHGYVRTQDLSDAFHLRSFAVVERQGRITGYSTGAHFRGHTVAESNDDAKALISSAGNLPEPGMLIPAGNGELLRWALAKKLRIMQPLSLMSLGFYQEPGGAFLPSIHG
jgi:predicted N-acetyltransferase YhbS